MSEWQIKEQERYDREAEEKLSHLPCCAWCEEPIKDGYAYDIGFGALVCESCMEDAVVTVEAEE